MSLPCTTYSNLLDSAEPEKHILLLKQSLGWGVWRMAGEQFSLQPSSSTGWRTVSSGWTCFYITWCTRWVVPALDLPMWAETAFLIKNMVLTGNVEVDLFLLKRNSKKTPVGSQEWNHAEIILAILMCRHNRCQCFLLLNDCCSHCLFQSRVTDCAGIRWEALLPWSCVSVCDFTALASFESLFSSSLVGTFLHELDASRFFELVFHIRHCLIALNYWILSKLGKKKKRAVSGSSIVFYSCPKAMSGWNKVHSISPIILHWQRPSCCGKEILEHALTGNCSMVK